MDIKAIVSEVVSELKSMPLEKKIGRWHRVYTTRVHFSHDTVKSMLIYMTWEKCLDLINGKNNETNGPLWVEKALLKLSKKGVLKEKVIYKTNSFRLKLANSQYRIYKLGENGIFASPWPSDRRCKILTSEEAFSNFIEEFDNEIPEIISNVSSIMETIKKREWEDKKRLIEKEIKNELVRSLIDQFLRPMSLSVNYFIKDDDIVSMDISRLMSTHLEIPLDQLADKLKDSASITASLEVEMMKGEDEKDFSGLFDKLRQSATIK